MKFPLSKILTMLVLLSLIGSSAKEILCEDSPQKKSQKQNKSSWEKRLKKADSFWSFKPLKRPSLPDEISSTPTASSKPTWAPNHAPLQEYLEAWYVSSTLSLRDRELVLSWNDQSGKNRNLIPTRSRLNEGFGHPPRFIERGKIQGHPAIRFGPLMGLGVKTPTDSHADLYKLKGNSGYTFIMVVYLDTLPQRQNVGTLFGFGDPAPGANFGKPTSGFIELHPASSRLSHSGGFGHNAALSHFSLRRITHRPLVLTLIKKPGAMTSSTEFFVNGQAQTQNPLKSTLSGSQAIPDMRLRSDWSIFLGSALKELAHFRGDVSEVAFYSTALTQAQREAVEAGLLKKYKIESSKKEAQRTHPIDAFVLKKLKQARLSSAPPASKQVLIRRAYFDLLGLPPSPEKVKAFVQDKTPYAWERLIDELLDSPRYGERWGRHWLDVARYADTGGYETDIYYRNAWRFRDYVVKSFNDDKPFDLFVQEQIAGDELWPDNLDLAGSYVIDPEKIKNFEALTATGFYALGPQIHESNMDAKKLRLERLTDWVDTTGSAFLGLTLACARCHDHKTDPISQRDYYSLQAVFAQSREAEIPIQHGMGIADYKQHYPAVIRVDEARKAYRLYERKTGGRQRTPQETQQLQQLKLSLADALLSLPIRDAQGVAYDGLMEPPKVSVLQPEIEALVPPIFILERGELHREGEKVNPALPQFLAAKTEANKALPSAIKSRGELARWITRSDHPLTSRVMVNRIWQWHFGQGLVPTANDFGAMGIPPSHPLLLDWLAHEFIAHGWSIKTMHRLIMTSKTYQQSSNFSSETHQNKDPDNRLLWRTNRRRLEGEALWDAIHSVAGTLNLRMGGRPVMPPLIAEELTDKANWVPSQDPGDHTRRGIYIIVRRNFRFPLFEIFDAPVNAVSCAGREVSTVAPQALWLLNNHTSFQQSQNFATRLLREAGNDSEKQIQRAFNLALQRDPNPQELKESLDLLVKLKNQPIAEEDFDPLPDPLKKLPKKQAKALIGFCLMLLNLNEFIYID